MSNLVPKPVIVTKADGSTHQSTRHVLPDTPTAAANRIPSTVPSATTSSELSDVETRQAEAVARVIAETPEHPRKGNKIVVNVTGENRIIKITAFRDGYIYGHTVDPYDIVDGFSVDDGVRPNEIVRK